MRVIGNGPRNFESHGQETITTPELATTLSELLRYANVRTLTLNRLNVHQTFTQWAFIGIRARTHATPTTNPIDGGLDSNKYGFLDLRNMEGLLGLSESGHPKMSWQSTGRSRST
ncbi:hypothetical protein TNCV_1159681 [Trichonephila clavipes]|nr:hypothetical protein TNCV_1159681 [Trichonephila clavipes]